jgi:hypothetical protein
MNLYISDKLQEILNEIKDSSIVAKMLLSPQDFSEQLISKDDFSINYLDLSETDTTKISYLNKDRIESLDLTDPFQHKRRFIARPGSVIGKIFNNVRDRDIEIFTYAYRSLSNRVNFTFKIVSGDDIRSYYHLDSYKHQSGSLGNSCMKWEVCQKYFDLYAFNTNVVSLLAMLDENDKLLGRALLWNCLDVKVMDRIYTVDDEHMIFHFKKWAIDNNYIYKHEQKWNNSLFFEQNGTKVLRKLSVKLDYWKFSKFPYVDTFKFLDRSTGTLYNYIYNDEVRTLCGSDGAHLESDIFAEDYKTNIFHHRSETVGIIYDMNKIDTNLKLRAHSYSVNWSNVNNLYIHKEDSEYIESIDDHIFVKTLDHLNNNEAISYLKEKIKKQSNTSNVFDPNEESSPSSVTYLSGARVFVSYAPLVNDREVTN